MNGARFVVTRIVEDNGEWGTVWFVLDTVINDVASPYIGPFKFKTDAEDEAARWNREPFKAPTSAFNDWNELVPKGASR